MRALLSLFAATLFAGCTTVPDVVWQPVCKGTQECDPSTFALKEQACSVPSDGRKVDCSDAATPDGNNSYKFKIAYLEYPNEFIGGDAVSPRDPQQLQAILKEIGTSKRPLLVSVYVHGWHHNASKDDDNVQKYPYMLARYAYVLRHMGKQDYDVLGIYVGWRGESNKGPFNVMTIGDRAEAADHLGYASLLAIELKQIAQAMHATNPQSRMVILGHSLGGRILSRAFLPAAFVGEPQPVGPGTLIVTANAAIGADAYRTLYDSPYVSAQERTPTWVNFTAKDDAATGRIYPEAIKAKWLFPDNPLDESPDTKKAIGHYDPYVTHQISIQNCEPTGTPSLSSCGWDSELDDRTYSDYWRMKDYRLFTMKYGDASDPQSILRHCVFMVDYPRSDALENRIRQENPYLCSGVFEKDYDKPASTAPRKIPLSGRLWNVRVDSSVFDFAEPNTFMDFSIHNGYVQTDLTAMLVRLAFERDIDMTASSK